MKWNMGWMHDTLDYFSQDPIFRKYHANKLTFSMLYAFTENFVLPFSHDEVVHGKRSLSTRCLEICGRNSRFSAPCSPTCSVITGKKLLFAGFEFGQWNEWNFDQSLDWHLTQYEPHAKLTRFVQALNWTYRTEPALHQVDFEWQGFEWIDFSDYDSSVIAFLRRGRNPEDNPHLRL
jgi:1,4-alpha-glucan branching enzyme